MDLILPDGPYAAYCHLGRAPLAAMPDGLLGGVDTYLGVLGPTALRRLPFPRPDETLGLPLAGFCATLFDGVRRGVIRVREGGGRLATRIEAAAKDGAPIDIADSFLRALYDARSRNGRSCLAFELRLSSASAVSLRADPATRVEQGGRTAYATVFAAGTTARIWPRVGTSGSPIRVQVGRA